MIKSITTGEQTVSATGAVTGSLDTSAITGDFTICVRVRGLSGSQSARVAIEDTANSTPFSDVSTVCEFDVKGAESVEGDTFKVRSYDIPSIRIGAANTKLRANVTAISAGASAEVEAWLEQ